MLVSVYCILYTVCIYVYFHSSDDIICSLLFYWYSRIRILPPLDVKVYRLLLQISVAVLDPFPVGMHVQMLDAMKWNIPIVSY